MNDYPIDQYVQMKRKRHKQKVNKEKTNVTKAVLT